MQQYFWYNSYLLLLTIEENWPIGPLQDPVTWYGINYAVTQVTQWHFQNKGESSWTGKSSLTCFCVSLLSEVITGALNFELLKYNCYAIYMNKYISMSHKNCHLALDQKHQLFYHF